MGILSAEFFALVVGTMVLFHAFNPVWWRKSVLACASMIFVMSYAGNGLHPVWTIPGAVSLLPLVAFALVGFAAIKVAGSVPSWLLVLAVIAVYALVRYFPPLLEGTDLFVAVGASYILFRILHLILDKSQNALTVDLRLRDYLAYLFFFPTFLAGPIWRYEEYLGSWDTPVKSAHSGEKIFTAFSRIANGCLKILVVTWICGIFHEVFFESSVLAAADTLASALYFSLAAILYLLIFYFDFSGYMDIVVGIGGLFGLTLPENFNAPFQSADIIDFWNRWHITLSKWMQQYLFMPLVTWLSRRFLGIVKIQYLGAIGYLAVFLVVGVWHGVSLRYVCFGCIVGFAASATKLWDSWLIKLVFPGKTEKAVKMHIMYRKFMNALALFIVASALVPLWISPEVMALFDISFVACGLMAGMLGAAALSVLDRFLREAISLLDRPGRLMAGKKWPAVFASLGSELWLASRCVAIFGILAVQNSDMPAFLYQGF